jgi:hypothetical protein
VSQQKVISPKETLAMASPPTGWGERIAYFFLDRTPLVKLVYWVAGIKSSVHAKLVTGFMLVTLLVVAMGVLSLQAITKMSHQSILLDEAHKRVEWSRQIQHALALQMNFTAMALLLQDEATVEKILRENNRFNNILALIAQEAVPADPYRARGSFDRGGRHCESVARWQGERGHEFANEQRLSSL